MLIASEPDDITGEEGCGVELTSGAQYATAKGLERRALGYVTGPGGELPGMYWSNADGLYERGLLIAAKSEPHPSDICACGHYRNEHPENGPCSHGDYHQPTQCMSFRLSCTAAEMCEAMDEWDRICEARGV